MAASLFFRLIQNPVRFRLFLLSRLPAAYFSGLRIEKVNEESCSVSVPYKWFTKNPFRSTYFACLGMAAEMSTGILAMAHLYRQTPPVSMLIVAAESRFHKKATGKTVFVCKEGNNIKEAIEKANVTGEPQTITVSSMGFNNKDEVIAEFKVTWSFKIKRR